MRARGGGPWGRKPLLRQDRQNPAAKTDPVKCAVLRLRRGMYSYELRVNLTRGRALGRVGAKNGAGFMLSLIHI
eukprot:5631691-Prymnesium_polylepis.1